MGSLFGLQVVSETFPIRVTDEPAVSLAVEPLEGVTDNDTEKDEGQPR